MVMKNVCMQAEELGMGIEPSRVGDKTLGFGVWRYRRYSFFAASFSFFFPVAVFLNLFKEEHF
jgi:hypothetical protein